MKTERENQLEKLQRDSFDILVIGGGATGAGIALDAATRGYKAALVEAEDFASGTSSRSTKLLHGGVRYLEEAVKHLNINEFKMVKHSLHERSTLLSIAPHLTKLLPIFIPTYTLWDKFYYGIGMKIYDLMSGSHGLKSSHFVSKKESQKLFPLLDDKNLKGGIIYYDGQFDDARMNISLAITAASYGAAIANYVSVVALKENGAIVKDKFSGKEWEIHANLIVNATGPFADSIRLMDNPHTPNVMKGSAGTHILLDRSFCPHETGILIPKTPDGRVIFILPWEESTLVGTTDIPAKIVQDPQPTDEEIEFLLNTINKYLSRQVTRADIKSSWCGIRPLVQENSTTETAKLSRDYKIEVSTTGLYSIMGGKWTSYRLMGEDLLNTAITNGDLPFKGKCVTKITSLVGAQNPLPVLETKLDADIIAHLLHAYGDRADQVVEIAESGYSQRLAIGYPYIEAEVIYAAKHEYACTEMDVLSRRTRLFTQDEAAAQAAIPTVRKLLSALKFLTPF